MRLTLQQSGDVVTGTAEIWSAVADATLPVHGQIDRDGTLTLIGSVQGTIPGGGANGHTDSVQLTSWTTAVNDSAMTGRFVQETAGWYGFEEFRFTSRLDGEISMLARQ
jgi:hypothetical protein